MREDWQLRGRSRSGGRGGGGGKRGGRHSALKDASDAADETNSEVSGGLHHLIVAPTVRDDVALDKRTRGRRSREKEKGS